jgi:hypothetical protein
MTLRLTTTEALALMDQRPGDITDNELRAITQVASSLDQWFWGEDAEPWTLRDEMHRRNPDLSATWQVLSELRAAQLDRTPTDPLDSTPFADDEQTTTLNRTYMAAIARWADKP